MFFHPEFTLIFFFFLSVPSIPFLLLGTAPSVEALKSACKARSTARLWETEDRGLRSAAPSPPRGGRFKVSKLLATTHLQFPLPALLSPFIPSQVTEGCSKMFPF